MSDTLRRMHRSRRTVVALIGVPALLIVAAGCKPDADPEVVSDLEESGLALHLPEIRGKASVAVQVIEGEVVLSYDDDGYRYTVSEQRSPKGALCRGIHFEEGSDCSETDGVMRADFEEMSVVAVTRGETVLVARGLVTESDAALVDDVVAALSDAPEVSAQELVEAVS